MPFDGVPDGYRLATEALALGILPPERLSIWEWADKHIVLPKGTSPKTGQYRTDLTPMAREIMEVLSPHHPAKKIVAMMSSQLMKTQVGLNFIMFYQAHDAQTELVVYPTIDLAEDWSNDKYTPIAMASPAVRNTLMEAKSRDGGNTILKKSFLGGSMKVAGANTPSSLASRGGAIVYFDEVDRYPQSAGIEGDPITIGERALIAYQENAKEYLSSTPTIESLSRIFKEFQLSDQRHYHVPCPHCATLQVLKWDNFKWDAGQPHTAHFVCTENGCIIHEHDKVTMLPDEQMGGAAKWIAANPGSKIPGFHAWAAYAGLGMGLSWHTLAEKWEECGRDPEKEKAFINIYRGECFKDPTEKLDWEVIKSRAEAYPMREIPAGCLMLTAGVDVQGNRLALQLTGWGPNGQVWPGIDWIELPGDPTQGKVWADLDVLLQRPIVNRWGVSIKISAVAVDSGYLPDDVLKFVRPREHRNVYAIKGSSVPGKTAISTATPQDRTARGKQMKRGAKSWQVGTDAIKATIFLWLQDDGKFPHAQDRRVHFSAELPDEYFSQLCAEIYDPHKKKWVKQQQRNEALDTLVYAIAVARHPRLRIHMMKDSDWTRYRAVIEPATGDLFAQNPDANAAHAPAPATETPAPAKPRARPGRRANWVNGYKK